jgi:hypothetical protein
MRFIRKYFCKIVRKDDSDYVDRLNFPFTESLKLRVSNNLLIVVYLVKKESMDANM